MGKKKLPKIVKEIQNYPEQIIDYSYQKNVSHSQLTIFEKCPYYWSLQYRDKKRIYSASIHAVFGTSLHETLQLYLETAYRQSFAEADRLDLIDIYEESLRTTYKKEYKKNNNIHFSEPGELDEFYSDGINIIDFFKKRKSKYFSKRGWWLVGCELPVTYPPNPFNPNVLFQGHLDVVMYHEPTKTFEIIDFKTSTRGWGDKEKKDEIKQSQIILYKTFFAKQFNIPLDHIKVKYMILKRKLPVLKDGFPVSRIQEHKPSQGKVKINKAIRSLENFVGEAFKKEGYSTKKFVPVPSAWNCKFCPYALDNELCGNGKEFI